MCVCVCVCDQELQNCATHSQREREKRRGGVGGAPHSTRGCCYKLKHVRLMLKNAISGCWRGLACLPSLPLSPHPCSSSPCLSVGRSATCEKNGTLLWKNNKTLKTKKKLKKHSHNNNSVSSWLGKLNHNILTDCVCVLCSNVVPLLCILKTF